MPEKMVVLFDNANNPLQVVGIRVELFDTCTLLHADNSENLKPALGNLSNEWGVRLPFRSIQNPVDICVVDASYEYPGNGIRHLNGAIDDKIHIDLFRLPSATGGQSSSPKSAHIIEIAKWVKKGINWDDQEQSAVLNLISNYINMISIRLEQHLNIGDLVSVAENWGEAMSRIGFPVDLLKI